MPINQVATESQTLPTAVAPTILVVALWIQRDEPVPNHAKV
jgi:hypothetical protein